MSGVRASRATWLDVCSSQGLSAAPQGLARLLHRYGPDMSDTLIACPECDLLQKSTPLSKGAVARCPRCRMVLYRLADDNLDRPLAYTLAATVLFVVANMFPIVGLELQGQSSAATLFGTAQALYEQLSLIHI